MLDQTNPKLEILLAAAECFMEQGFHETSVDDVARRLKATKGRVYHYYPSKIELFFDVHREGMDRLFSAVERAQKTAGDGITVLIAMMREHALAQFENQALESVVVQGVQLHRFGSMTPSQRDILSELIASRDKFESLFKKAVNAAKKDGTMADLDTSIAVKTLLGGIQWSLIWYRPRANNNRENNLKLADAMVRTLVQGLRTR